jgi:hypothetical protein
MEKLRSWVRTRPDVWVVGSLVVGLFIGGIIGGLIGNAGKSTLESEKIELQAAVSSAEGKAQAAEGRQQRAAERLASEKNAVLSKAHREATELVGDAKAEAEELEGIEGKIASAEGQLSTLRSEISGEREVAAKSTIPGNGTYQAEVDFIPGTYRAEGGAGCYWATLNSADPYDIASNENASGPTIASITTPYFQTEGCGQWERIGE